MKMKEKVHKYFLAGTDEEVQIGDVITVPLTKEFDDGRAVTKEMEFKVTEDTLPYAIDLGIIEAEDEEEDNDLIDFDDEDDDEILTKKEFSIFSQCVAEDIEELTDKIDKLDSAIKSQEDVVTCLEALVEKVAGIKPKKPTASSKKKK